MTTIAITGTLGAGKGTVVDYLKTKGFVHYSVRGYLEKEMARRGLPSNRDNMRAVANDLRKTHFPGFIIDELLKEARMSKKPAIIESIRALGEVELLREKAPECVLLAVDADRAIRYKRIVARGSSTDDISFEKFVIDEERELNAREAWDMNIRGCMAEADFLLENSGSHQELEEQIDDIVGKISSKVTPSSKKKPALIFL